jgi:hypothetical protein
MRSIPWWVWISAAPFGLGAWAPLVPGSALRRRLWLAWGAAWSVVTLAGWIDAIGSDGGDAWGGLLILLGWAGAVATALVIRPAYLLAAGSTFEHDRAAAEQRLRERHEAQKLALENPRLALELGVGRPDRPGAQAAGLVDVNNAAVPALEQLPGVDAALASRIADLREQLNGFESLNDFGEVLDLDGDAVERLRDRVVFLPR